MARTYRLKEGNALRGWDKLPFAVVEARASRVRFVPKDVMAVLMRCDGSWDFDSILTSEEDRACVATALEAGIVEPCDDGRGISPDQRYRRFPNRFMDTVHWSITGRCNYRCRHCYMSAPSGHYGELSHEAVMSIARQIGECGVLHVSLTGGEPLLRPDFLDIVGELSAQGVRIRQLYTNGALLSADVLDGLAERGQRPVVIMSFDGVGHHDWLRGVDGAERAVDRAIALCAERDFAAQAQVVLHRGNVGSLRETVRHLAAVGCSSVRVGHVNDTGEWLEHGRGMTLTRDEHLEAVLRYIPEYYEDGMPLPLILSGAYAATPEEPDRYEIAPCHPGGDDLSKPTLSCARHTLQLYPDARPAICEDLGPDFVGMLPIASDDPDQPTTTLSEVLSTGSPYMRLMELPREELLAANPECARCPYLRLCGAGCRASARSATGSFLAKDSDTCAIFREGWVPRIMAAARAAHPGATCAWDDDPLFQGQGEEK